MSIIRKAKDFSVTDTRDDTESKSIVSNALDHRRIFCNFIWKLVYKLLKIKIIYSSITIPFNDM